MPALTTFSITSSITGVTAQAATCGGSPRDDLTGKAAGSGKKLPFAAYSLHWKYTR